MRFSRQTSNNYYQFMSKKTERKNKINLVVKWPTSPFFTLEDVFSLQPDAKRITLRVRFGKELTAERAVEIGSKTGEQGRPRKVYAFTPVPESTLKLAQSQRIALVDQNRLQKLMTLPSVTPFVTRNQSVAV